MDTDPNFGPDERPDVPSWFERLGVPAWVCQAGGRVVRANAAAERLVGVTEPMEGRNCRETVRAVDAFGVALFRAVECPLHVRAASGGTLPASRLCVGLRRRWVRIVSVPLEPDADGRALLLHCAVDADRDERARRYLERIADRSRAGSGDRPRSGTGALTAREREILDLLGQDQDPQSIARALRLSPATVRNHVQHVLEKLGAHSIQEAVAMRLLEGNGG